MADEMNEMDYDKWKEWDGLWCVKQQRWSGEYKNTNKMVEQNGYT